MLKTLKTGRPSRLLGPCHGCAMETDIPSHINLRFKTKAQKPKPESLVAEDGNGYINRAELDCQGAQLGVRGASGTKKVWCAGEGGLGLSHGV